MKFSFATYAALCLTGLCIRITYEILKKNGKVDTKNAGIFAVVFSGMALMLASWIFMCPLDPWRVRYHGAIRGTGLAALTAGLVLAITAFIQLRSLENVDHLVTNGLFAKIRHPMYTGFILWISGWVIHYGAAMSSLIGLACIGNILYWRRLEEIQLTASYGESYLAYRRKTWF